MTPVLDRRLSIAPMMEWTDRHERYFLRLISRHVLLYTEMVVTGALIRGDRERFLRYNAEEHPLALQLGGNSPRDLADCARMAADWGYDEVNLNVGCPSDRVGAGGFGAALMAEPALVAKCVEAMGKAVSLPVTVKHRIGIDDKDGYKDLTAFVSTVASAGCKTFIVHARKAWLTGLSPKENREVPPLRHDLAYDLKRDFPALEIILNGGIRSLEEIPAHLEKLDGVMIGRAAYETPFMLSEADRMFFGSKEQPPSRHALLEAMLPYMERQLSKGVPLRVMAKHLMGLFHGLPGAKAWRRTLGERMYREGAGVEVVREAAESVKTA